MKPITSNYKTELGKSLRHRLEYAINIVDSTNTSIVQFGTNSIVNVKTVDSSDPLSRVLPTKTITFSVLDLAGNFNPANPSGTWTQLSGSEKTLLSVTQRYASNQSYVLPSEIYFLDGQATWDDGIATFHATGRISQFQGKAYDGNRAWSTDMDDRTSMTSMFQVMFGDFGLSASDYNVSADSCATYKRSCPKEGTTTQAEALQLTANANGSAVWESCGKINVARTAGKTSSAMVRTLTPRDIYDYSLEQADELGTCVVNNYAVEGEILPGETDDYKIVCQGNVLTTGSVMFEILFDGSVVDISGSAGATINLTDFPLDGFTVTDATISGTEADTLKFGIHITGHTLFSLTLTPYGMKGSFSVDEITNPGQYSVYKTWSLWAKKIKRSTKVSNTATVTGASQSAKTLELDNQLITSTALASEVSTRAINYLGNRQLLKVKTRGNPELELFDVVRVVTPKDIYYGLLVERTGTYTGTLEDNLVLRVIGTSQQIKFINRKTNAWYIGAQNTFWRSEIQKQNGGTTPVVGDLIYSTCLDLNGTNDNTLWSVMAVSEFYITAYQISIL